MPLQHLSDHRLSTLVISVSALALTFGPAVEGSGFSVPEISIAGLGTSNALVANPRETGAFSYNPAAMGFHEYSSLSVGAIGVVSGLEVRTMSGHHESDSSDVIGIPVLQGAFKLNSRWTLGLGVTSPFGLETDWSDNTFPSLAVPIEPFPAGAFHPTRSKLATVVATPTLTFAVTENLSVATGVDYYDAKRVVFNTPLINVHGDGDGWGFNLAALYTRGPWSLGASYHSNATLDIEGDYEAPPGLGGTQNAKAELELPWRVQAGVRFQASEQLAVEFDLSRIGWSSFDVLEIKEKSSGAVLTSNANHWDDVNAYRVGLTYDLNDRTQLRLGYTFDKTGQNDDYFSARIPDEDRQLFSVGLGHRFGDGWVLEAGYMYVIFEDRDFNGARAFNPLVSRDVNGTSAINGDYEADVHLFGLGITKTFM